MKTVWCESVNGITSSTDDCTDDLSMATRKEARGHSMSYRYVLKTFDKNKNNSYSFRTDEISSSCYTGTPTPGSDLDGLSDGVAIQIPTGNGSSTPFYMTLKTYPGSITCDETTHGSVSLAFPNGLIKDSATTKYFVDFLPAHKLYVRMSTAEICDSQRSATTFAGGDGTRLSPYLICNVNQFYNTQTNSTSSFKLLNDIDLSTKYYGITTLPNIINNLPCLEKGSNFLPLGYDTMTCTASAATFSTSDFDGGGKTIKGLRIKMPGKDYVGIFTKKLGGEIRRLKLRDIEIKGQSFVGVLAGVTETKFQDIIGQKITIKTTGAYTGTLAGVNFNHPTACEFRNIRLDKINLSSTNPLVGGIIGQSASCDYYNNSVSGHLFSATNRVGGITSGFSNGTMDQVSFEGYLRGSNYVGGLAGDLFNGIITNSRSQGGIQAFGTTAGIYAGGLVGYTNGNPSATSYITNNYWFGHIDHNCTFGGTCGISNIVGDPGLWADGAFTTNYYVANNSVAGLSVSDPGTLRVLGDFYSSAAVWPAAFTTSNTDLPRLNHEITYAQSDLRHQCQSTVSANESVAVQVAAGFGTRANPISICHYSQLKDMQAIASHTSKYYKMLSFIVATDALPTSTQTFSGVLEGNDKGIIRLEVQGAAAQDIAWWNTISASAVLKNFYFYASQISDVSTNAVTTALIAKNNYGEINAVHAVSTKSSPGSFGQHSLYVNTNFGTIKNSFVDGSATVKSNVGAAIYSNNGTLEDSSITSYFNCVFGQDCSYISGVTVNNQGIIRRNVIRSTINESSASAVYNNFSFISVFNEGVIEDIHIKTSNIVSKSGAAHAMTVKNRPSGIIRRVYNDDGRVHVYTFGLPSTTPVINTDYLNASSSAIGFNQGTVGELAYKNVSRWIYASQYTYSGNRTSSGANECTYVLSGGLPASWNTAMGSLFGRFGMMVVANQEDYLFTQAPLITAGDDTFYVYDSSPCSMVPGNPVIFFWPFDHLNGTGLITQAQSQTFATFSAWSGVQDITTDDSAIYQYEYDKMRGIDSQKPNWIFDTTNSLRLYR